MKPKIYLAGKIGKNDWRHSLVKNLRGHTWADGNLEQEDWICTGPFFTSCDHGCSHHVSSHGVFAGCVDPESFMSRAELLGRIKKAVRASDAIFVYIDSMDCPETVFETGYASEKTPVYIVYGPNVDKKEFWLQGEDAEMVFDITGTEQLSLHLDFVKAIVNFEKIIGK